MIENFRGEIPPDDINILPVLPVTQSAIMGIFGYNFDSQPLPVYDEAQLLERLSNEWPALDSMAETLCEDLGFNNGEAECFKIGYAFTCSAIANQAELLEGKLYDTQETVYESVTGNIILSEKDDTDYVTKSLRTLEKINPHLTSGWLEYLEINNLAVDEAFGTAFVMGGVMAHDLLLESVNQTTEIDYYQSNVN